MAKNKKVRFEVYNVKLKGYFNDSYMRYLSHLRKETEYTLIISPTTTHAEIKERLRKKVVRDYGRIETFSYCEMLW